MVGETNLNKLLAAMSPQLMPDEYVFCSLQGEYAQFEHLLPLATFRETEGLTLVLTKAMAIANNLPFESVFKGITLTIHSSLDAVGLTAAVSTKLAEKGISANVIAAYYHDHIFVQVDKADLAMTALAEFN
ncbi:ACT domain-containing protein [Thalassotalea agariperforans]